MKIAIIGSGISGLTLAYYLDKKYNVTLFEKEDRIGGHTHTHTLKINQDIIKVDSGFIVFNKKTYPNFIKLLKELKVSYQPSSMSFSVQSTLNRLEYAGNNLKTLFAQKKNLLNIYFWRLLWEILKFNKLAKKILQKPELIENLTIQEFVNKHNFSEYFLNNYLLPMSSAIWSSSYKDIKKFSLLFFLNFLNNHGMININDRPQWLTIKNGSETYVQKIVSQLKGKIKLNSIISNVYRNNGKCIIEINKKKLKFDFVFFACHADQALKLIKNPNLLEKNILGSFKYSSNKAVLHQDTNLMPKNKSIWSAWNYIIKNKTTSQARVTYNMNILQSISQKNDLLVSLNSDHDINPKAILKSMDYTHPIFNLNTYLNQKQQHLVCKDGFAFSGAYWGNGFHEDGVVSALNAIKYSGINP
ncbi:FAD-dependent oxidoreductase [Methylophilaceae bacterium]|nr:FAD-dependent oxidoreductase [Methylophilaceae bacterium]